MPIRLRKPDISLLPAYAAALHQGWAPTTIREQETIAEQLALIDTDPDAFIAAQDDREAKAGPVILADGSRVPRIPGYIRWMIDDREEFCGNINFRWQPGTDLLPPHVLGHVGYMVVPWKRGNGYAAQALRLLLPDIRKEGLAFVDVVIDPDNIASQKTTLAAGGRFVGPIRKPASQGGAEALLYRIDMD